TIPDVWKLVCTNRCTRSISDQWVDRKNKCCDRITTTRCAQCIDVSSCCIVWTTVPGIWKLVRTNCCISSISDQRIDCKNKCCDRITAACRNQRINISSGSVIRIAIPNIRHLIRTEIYRTGCCYLAYHIDRLCCRASVTTCICCKPGPRYGVGSCACSIIDCVGITQSCRAAFVV